jgi:hypothetical protein
MTPKRYCKTHLYRIFTARCIICDKLSKLSSKELRSMAEKGKLTIKISNDIEEVEEEEEEEILR